MPATVLLSSLRLRGASSLAAGALLCTIALPGLAQQAAPEAKSSSLPSLHSDLKFSVFAPARLDTSSVNPADAALDLKQQIIRVSAGLQQAAHGLYGSKMKTLGAFDVYVADSAEAETLSSATGKIALYAGLAQLTPSDEWLAFVIAREMGHVLAGHHDDNSAASIITSVIMNLIVPGSSLLKSAVSLVSSQTAAAAGAERQVREADEIGLRLLEAAGYRLRGLAQTLAAGPAAERLGSGSWARAFQQSASGIQARAAETLAGTAVPVLLAQTGAQSLRLQTIPQSDAVPGVVSAPVPEVGPAAVQVSVDQVPAPVALVVSVAPVAPVAPVAAPVAPQVLQVQVAALPVLLPDLPVIRARPSGVAGPLLLGGYSVPARRLD